MYIIGLTGGIASGKSVVSGILSSLGAYIIDADQIAREVVAPDEPAWSAIVSHFGEKVLRPDRQIDRNRLGSIVFHDDKARTALEEITHCVIKERILSALAQAEKSYTIAVLDVPLLLEVGWQTMADAVWVVYVTRQKQITRLIGRNQLSVEQAEARINAQMDLEHKVAYADVVINNNDDLESTKRQVLAAWQNITTFDKVKD